MVNWKYVSKTLKLSMYFDPKNPPLETYPKKKILTSRYTDVCRRTVTAELLIMGGREETNV